MLKEYKIKTSQQGFYNITSFVRQTILEAGVKEGIAVVFTPDTDASIKLSDSGEAVIKDEISALERIFPNYPDYKNPKGNTPEFVRSMVLGQSQTLIVHESAPLLGYTQCVFLLELGSPCERCFYVKIVSG